MNTKYITKTSRCKGFLFGKLKETVVVLGITLFLCLTGSVSAQEVEQPYSRPSWWFGVAGGANLNFFRGSTHELNSSITPPLAFHEGTGVGLFLAPTVEFYRPNTVFGFMIQLGYDSRKGDFDQIMTTCNCPADLSGNISYFSLETSLRIAPFKNNFYLYTGPRFAYNYDKSFSYQLGINPDFPNQPPSPEVTGDFNNINQLLVSMQIGAGFDIPISSQNRRTQFMVSPFISFHPYFGQDPRSIETWNVTTLRAGAAVKFGVAKKATPIDSDENNTTSGAVIVPATAVEFVVYSPENIPKERLVRETFPLRNYVFFDLGSTEIPKRYNQLEKNEVAEFKEDQIELKTPENLTGRSKRQLVVYYNILNILGDRMGKSPNSTIKLVGSSEVNSADGREMAESIKAYLVDVFSIDGSRIVTEGRDKPKIPSRQEGGTEELVLLKEGDRRVSIESNSPELLMEFQSGPLAPLKPLEVLVLEEAPVESYVTFENKGASDHFTSWILEVKDDQGFIQTFGPYTEDKVVIPGNELLGSNAKGNYQVKMIGTTHKGETIEKETNVSMVLWVPTETEVAMRFSVIYEFNESKAIGIYDKYLTDIVVNKIPQNGHVIIHGHTDIIGDPKYNENLSMERAKDVKRIMELELKKQGRKDVTFEVMGFGENQKLSPFENKYPEERFYNRTVLIDILPKK